MALDINNLGCLKFIKLFLRISSMIIFMCKDDYNWCDLDRIIGLGDKGLIKSFKLKLLIIVRTCLKEKD